MAANRGHCGIVHCLLLHGAIVDARDVEGNTAMMYASKKGHVEVLEILVEAKHQQWDSVNQQDQDQQEEETIDPSLKDIVNLQNKHLQTALSLTVVSKVSSQRLLVCIRKLLHYGADIHMMDESGWTPLLLTIFHNEVAIVRCFAEWNCDFLPPVSQITQLKPWVAAISFGHVAICQVMFAGGCDLATFYRVVRDPRVWDKYPQLGLFPAMREWMKATTSDRLQCKSLHAVCRGTIRTAMGQGVPVKVGSSGLPKLLQAYVVKY